MSVDSQPNAAPLRPHFPFVAVIGQPLFKRALLLGLLAPQLGGVLVQGPRGVAKSTLARGLSDFLLPNQGRFVELPLGTSSERLTGSMDIKRALEKREQAFQPGLLATADGGILYIDEVNLLDDALVDLLLDAAASGVHHVERDGISHRHSSRFLLIGTMNPDEGELRPQLSDRFGLSVQLETTFTAAERVEIVRSRLAYDADPNAFCARYLAQTHALAESLTLARQRLPQVTLPAECETLIAERAMAYQLEGLRADIAWRQAALANAALEGRSTVTHADIALVEPLVINHRLPPEGPMPPPTSTGSAGNGSSSAQGSATQRAQSSLMNTRFAAAGAQDSTSQSPPAPQAHNKAPRVASTAEQAMPESSGSGRHHATTGYRLSPPGNVRYTPAGRTRRSATVPRRSATARFAQHQQSPHDPIDWYRTVLSARHAGAGLQLKRRAPRASAKRQQLIMLDLSGSTLSGRAIDHAAMLVMALSQRARHQRAAFALLGFADNHSQWICRGRRPPAHLADIIRQLTAGGGTPLRDALNRGRQFLTQRLRQHPRLISDSFLLTDGRSSALPPPRAWPGALTVIDNEQGRIRLGRARQVAERCGGHYQRLEEALQHAIEADYRAPMAGAGTANRPAGTRALPPFHPRMDHVQ